jgi:hypothetical protein
MPVDSVPGSADRDPRTRLVREKYFCVRPKPLEQWLWSQRIPASAERVFWLHWQEGMQRGDWCSELPIRRVARDCHLDTSTVTRAYQLLTKLGCLRRSDPGRDPANPFQQATAVTEIRLPRELLTQLARYPNRRQSSDPRDQSEATESGQSRAGHISAISQGSASSPDAAAPSAAPARLASIAASTTTTAAAAGTAPNATPTSTDAPPRHASDLFPGLTGRARLRAIADLTSPMSPTERHAYQEAIRLHLPRMDFDRDSKLSPHARTTILQLLASLANANTPTSPTRSPTNSPTATTSPQPPRKLTLFELSRLHRELQSATSTLDAPELLRQVVWSIEAGALRRFQPRHALHIALKKIREGLWTRPNRMPPNWARALSVPTAPESCAHA